MGSNYVLGRSRENNLKRKLIGEGYFCLRLPMSAGGDPRSRIKPVDLVAFRKGELLLIQVSKFQRDIGLEEKEELTRLASLYGASACLYYLKGRRWIKETL